MATKAPKGDYRTEEDSLGKVQVPKSAYYGPQTERSKLNFPISTQRDKMPLPIIHALAMLKEVAAGINVKNQRINGDLAKAIKTACEDTYEGRINADEFPLVVWQTGSGTQSNMNVNEVIANRASEIISGTRAGKSLVHPNDHVNCGQSSNDIFPSAVNVSVAMETAWNVIPGLQYLRDALDTKAKLFNDIIKIGRTHLQDAVPMSVGQEISAWVAQLDISIQGIKRQLPLVCELAVGGTAVGTGLNASPGFDIAVCAELTRLIANRAAKLKPGSLPPVGVCFTPAKNKFAALAAHDSLVQLSGFFNSTATALLKIAQDLALLSSGPSCGFAEYILPANEPGSSIMPGKVNPTQCESMWMVAVQVMANNFAVTLAGSKGTLQLNVYKPVIGLNLLHSCQLLGDVSRNFADRCVDGMTLNEKQIKTYVENSLMLVTALAPKLGYDIAAKVAHHAREHGQTLKQAAVEMKVISAADFDKTVKPAEMAFPHQKQ